MKKMKKMAKAIVAMMLVMVMMFGVVPPLQSQAAPIKLNGGAEMKKATSIPSFGKQYYFHWTDVKGEDDENWFKFKTKSENAFYTIDIKSLSSSGVDIIMMEETEEEVTKSVGIKKNESYVINLKLKKNTWYYLKFWDDTDGDGTGNVSFIVSWRKDLEPDTRKTAKKIVQNTTYTCKIDGTKSNDSDWFKFVPATAGKYTITVRNVSAKSIRFLMQNEAGKSVDINDGIKNSKLYTVVIGKSDKVTLQKGKAYYFRIAGTTSVGQYKIRVTKR